MPIQDKIRDLSARWINPAYAHHVSPSTQVKDLAALAFELRKPEDADTALIRECLRRLAETGSLSRDGDE